jgi:ABC-2 type transport system permease protein
MKPSAALRIVFATALVQARLFFRNSQEWTRVLMMPLQALVAMAILVHAGRPDLAGYALTAALLFTIGDMGFFVGSEIVGGDRSQQVLELLTAAPTPYFVVLITRTLFVASVGLIGFAESWLIARFVFGVQVVVHHPSLLVGALLATVFAAGATAVLTAALFSLARSTRTLQNAVNGPFYLLGGVLVPAAFLPVWLKVLSPFVFFFWAASLVRDSFTAAEPGDTAFRLAMLAALGVAGALVGGLVLRRMLNHLRHNGRLGLA